MKKKEPKKEYRSELAQRYKRTRVDHTLTLDGVEYTAKETPFEEDICSMCIFKEIGDHCPKLEKHSTPVCFAVNRPDGKSVYFTLK